MDAGTTAQHAYQQILREYVAPALRELGFRGAPSRGNFRYETTTHAAEVRFQKSRSSSKQRVNFWVILHATDLKTEWVYWSWTSTPWSAVERADSNPRAVQILLARLETDPDPDIRKAVAWHLLPRVHEVVQITAVAAGLSALFAAAPVAFTVLRLCGAAYCWGWGCGRYAAHAGAARSTPQPRVPGSAAVTPTCAAQ
jgi:hypothetical protein